MNIEELRDKVNNLENRIQDIRRRL